MNTIKRRSFIKKAAVAAAGTGALIASCGKTEQSGTPKQKSSERFEWKLVTTWPPHFPILGDGVEHLAKNIDVASNGRLKIQVYGGGELVPALESFDAVSQGMAEMFHGASYYWAGKAPAAQLFAGVPFGMTAKQTNAWLFFGGGLELWKEVYEPFNLIPIPCGNSDGQMGGWFNKEINTAEDLKGLKMRMPGLGGKVITKTGATAMLSPASEIYTNLERGVIDATEWIGPCHDYFMGFHNIAKYYYYPSFAEPSAVLELTVNKDAYEKLPPDLQQILQSVAGEMNVRILSDFEAKNTEYLFKIKEEGKVQFKRVPDEVMKVFKEKTDEVISELIASDPLSEKIVKSYKSFQKRITEWDNMILLP